MKFFQQLLIAPAALGLLAPIAATANEVNLDVDSADLTAGQFSDYETSTKVTGKVTFNVGALNTDDDITVGTQMGDKLTSGYVSTFNVNTSFTGEDRLYARIKTGNMASTPWENTAYGTHLQAANNAGNALQVDKLWYEFPVGDEFKVWFGPRIEGYYMLASSPSIYKPVLKSHALGGNGAVYGSSTSPGFGAAWIQQTDSPSDFRWAVSSNYHVRSGDNSTNGILTDETNGKWLSKVEYGSPRMQVSLAYARHHCGNATGADGGCYDWAGYTSSDAADQLTGNAAGIGLRAYWKPEETGLMPSVQFGFDRMNIDDAGNAGDAEETTLWMTGLTWKDAFQDGNRLAAAIASPTTASERQGGADDGSKSGLTWEIYYDYQINDGVTLTPSIYGATDRMDGNANGHDDYIGALVQTTFKF